jgi:hypothetical protein
MGRCGHFMQVYAIFVWRGFRGLLTLQRVAVPLLHTLQVTDNGNTKYIIC